MYKDYNIGNNANGSGMEFSEQDRVLLNIIRNGANKVGILAAYKARKKCIALLKELSKAASEDYVDTLTLKYYPNEFKKVELGRKYRMYLVLSIIGIGCCIVWWMRYGMTHNLLTIFGEDSDSYHVRVYFAGTLDYFILLLSFTIISIYNVISVKKFFNQLMLVWERNGKNAESDVTYSSEGIHLAKK